MWCLSDVLAIRQYWKDPGEGLLLSFPSCLSVPFPKKPAAELGWGLHRDL